MVYLSFIIGIYLLLVKSEIRNKAYYLMFMSFLGLAILMPVIIKMSWAEIVAERFYRGYVIKKSWEIWSDNPFLGVGPGMYGGVVSVEFKSPIYDKYHFSEYWYNFGLKTFHSLDQFWPQIMVELSLPGLAMFLMILFLLSGIAMKKYKLVQSDYAKKFSLGLMIIPIIIFFYLFGSGLNLSCLGTYAILYGVLLGAKKE
jgi:O-antigen ligase